MATAHIILTTEGLVLTKRSSGEANTIVTILTEGAGLVRASAKSARLDASKLRFGLEPLTRARFSLVRGRYEWKLVGTDVLGREYNATSASARVAAGRVSRLLSRLVQGEEAAPPLYRIVAEGFSLLAVAGGKDEQESIECVLVLRILFNLGYLPRTPELAPFVNDEGLSVELAAQAAASRSSLIRAINDSLYASGL